jgi:hypothetical protein
MTREERNSLQSDINRYVERKATVKNKRKLSFVKMSFGMRLARLIPDLNFLGIDVSLMLAPLAEMFLPKKMGPLRFPIVEGHAEAWAKLEDEYREESGGIPDEVEEKFYEEYGLSVPRDLAIEAMRIKSSNRLADIAFGKRGGGGSGADSKA